MGSALFVAALWDRHGDESQGDTNHILYLVFMGTSPSSVKTLNDHLKPLPLAHAPNLHLSALFVSHHSTLSFIFSY